MKSSIVVCILCLLFICSSYGQPNRGRIQIQGTKPKTEKSIKWSRNSVISKKEALARLDELWQSLNNRKRKDRIEAYRKAKEFISRAPVGGYCVNKQTTWTFQDPKRKDKDARIDIEIIKGCAFSDAGDCSRPVVFIGESGSPVKHAQKQLLKVGGKPAQYIRNSGGVDGHFGRGTRLAVIAYQKLVFLNMNWEWDGIIGPKVWRRLGCNNNDIPVASSKKHQIVGEFESARSNAPNKITLRGWAFLNTSQNQNLLVEISVSNLYGRKLYTKANKERYDINREHSVKGNNGFDAEFSNLPGGNVSVCVTVKNGYQGAVLITKHLGCKSFTIASPNEIESVERRRNNLSTYDCRTGQIRCDGAFPDGAKTSRFVNICMESRDNIRLCYKLSEGNYVIPNSILKDYRNGVAVVKEKYRTSVFFDCDKDSKETTCKYEIVDVKNITRSNGWNFTLDQLGPWSLKQKDLILCTYHISKMDAQRISECLANGALEPYDGN